MLDGFFVNSETGLPYVLASTLNCSNFKIHTYNEHTKLATHSILNNTVSPPGTVGLGQFHCTFQFVD